MNTQKMIGVQVSGIMLVALAALATPAHAFGVSNGSFETGGFTDWNTLSSGNQAVLDNTAICGSATPCSGSPTNGTFGALLTTPGTANVSSLETFLGLTPGTLIASNVTGGSAVSQTFTLDTAGTLSFNWNFLTNETLRTPTANNDFASYFLTSSEVPLGTALGSNLLDSGTQLFDSDTGFNSVSLSLSAGTYTLKFLVADRNDLAVPSGLLVDNVAFQPVPEPAITSWLGIVLGLGVSARIQRGKMTSRQTTKES